MHEMHLQKDHVKDGVDSSFNLLTIFDYQAVLDNDGFESGADLSPLKHQQKFLCHYEQWQEWQTTTLKHAAASLTTPPTKSNQCLMQPNYLVLRMMMTPLALPTCSSINKNKNKYSLVSNSSISISNHTHSSSRNSNTSCNTSSSICNSRHATSSTTSSHSSNSYKTSSQPIWAFSRQAPTTAHCHNSPPLLRHHSLHNSTPLPYLCLALDSHHPLLACIPCPLVWLCRTHLLPVLFSNTVTFPAANLLELHQQLWHSNCHQLSNPHTTWQVPFLINLLQILLQ
jgi:hypothetical protein